MSCVNSGSMSIGQRHSKFCLFTHDEAWGIAADGNGGGTLTKVGCVPARIAFSELRHRAEKATSKYGK
jgi:hypothetical protein